MAQLTPQLSDTLAQGTAHVGSGSVVLKRLAERLQRQRANKVLDLGPVCQENIDFFAGRAKQLYLCDIFTQFNKIKKSKKSPHTQILELLDFPNNNFDCINLWDSLDHLADDEALKVVKRCHEMMKPYGMVLVTAMEKQLHPLNRTLFACGSDFRLSLRTLAQVQLPLFYRHNRALMSLLEPFQAMKIFRYHNGIREMLFQRTKRFI